MQQTASVGWEIEEHHSVSADGFKPYIVKLTRAFYLCVLLGVVEPARTDRDVYLGGHVHLAADNSSVDILDDFVADHIEIDGCVVGRAGKTGFVSYPSLFGVSRRAHGCKYNGIGLMLSHGVCP